MIIYNAATKQEITSILQSLRRINSEHRSKEEKELLPQMLAENSDKKQPLSPFIEGASCHNGDLNSMDFFSTP